MARRRGRRGGRRKLPVISLAIPIAQGFFAYQAAGGNLGETAKNFISFYTGFYGDQFELRRLLIGYGPWAVKKAVGMLHLIRTPSGLPVSLT